MPTTPSSSPLPRKAPAVNTITTLPARAIYLARSHASITVMVGGYLLGTTAALLLGGLGLAVFFALACVGSALLMGLAYVGSKLIDLVALPKDDGLSRQIAEATASAGELDVTLTRMEAKADVAYRERNPSSGANA